MKSIKELEEMLKDKKAFDRFEKQTPKKENDIIDIETIKELTKETTRAYKKYLEQMKEYEKLFLKQKKQVEKQQPKQQIEQPKKDNYLTGITNKILSKISIKTMLICNPLMLSFGVIVLGLEHNNIALAFLGLYALMWFFYLLYLSGKYITKKIIN